MLLSDEINRAPPKTQAALLEAMQERQATIEGVTYPLERPFLVLATQNPIEFEGTYPLPEAQLDRFLVRIGIGYPSRDAEWEVLERRLERQADEVSIEPVVDGPTLLAMQRAVETVHVSEPVGRYIVDLVRATRDTPRVQVGASPRGSLALLKLARGRAALRGRDFVTPGRREGGGRGGAGAPARAAARAVGAARPRRRRGGGAARLRADAARRGGSGRGAGLRT